MKVGDRHFRTIWVKETDDRVFQVIDQRFLPHRFVIEDIATVAQAATAIREMHVRGAGLIGATAGYAMYLAALEAEKSGSFDKSLARAAAELASTRPTAVNLRWAIDRQLRVSAVANRHARRSKLPSLPQRQWLMKTWSTAGRLAGMD